MNERMYDRYSIEEAAALQLEMARKVVFRPVEAISTIAGADISFNKNSDTMYAGIVLLSYPGMVLKAFALATYETAFPYVPGFLGFKEVPALLRTWALIPEKPDVIVLDGNGILHPRRMGVASHFGLLADQPAIGCAKSILYGKNNQPANARMSVAEITSGGACLGYALRTKANCKPVYISAGHLITQDQSLEVMKTCVRGYRIPEPTRLAHLIVNDFRTGKLSPGFRAVAAQHSLFDGME